MSKLFITRADPYSITDVELKFHNILNELFKSYQKKEINSEWEQPGISRLLHFLKEQSRLLGR